MTVILGDLFEDASKLPMSSSESGEHAAKTNTHRPLTLFSYRTTQLELSRLIGAIHVVTKPQTCILAQLTVRCVAFFARQRRCSATMSRSFPSPTSGPSSFLFSPASVLSSSRCLAPLPGVWRLQVSSQPTVVLPPPRPVPSETS